MTADWLEAARVLSLIVAVWFGLVGWTLCRLARPRRPRGEVRC